MLIFYLFKKNVLIKMIIPPSKRILKITLNTAVCTESITFANKKMWHVILVLVCGCLYQESNSVRKTYIFSFISSNGAFSIKKTKLKKEYNLFKSLICASHPYALCHLETYFMLSRSYYKSLDSMLHSCTKNDVKNRIQFTTIKQDECEHLNMIFPLKTN